MLSLLGNPAEAELEETVTSVCCSLTEESDNRDTPVVHPLCTQTVVGNECHLCVQTKIYSLCIQRK